LINLAEEKISQRLKFFSLQGEEIVVLSWNNDYYRLLRHFGRGAVCAEHAQGGP
jgi:hypothetical protein